MAAPQSGNKVVSGARVLVFVDGVQVGLFSSGSYNVVDDVGAVFILGRYSPAELDYLAQEPVAGTLTGWRVVNNGPHIVGLPALQNLLTAPYTSLSFFDRLTGALLGKVQGVRMTGKGTGHTARQLSEITIPFQGLTDGDESVTNSEAADSADLP